MSCTVQQRGDTSTDRAKDEGQHGAQNSRQPHPSEDLERVEGVSWTKITGGGAIEPRVSERVSERTIEDLRDIHW